MSSRRGELRIAALEAPHVAAAQALLAGERPAELLDRALAGTRECVALPATRGDGLLGVVVHGDVAGTRSTAAVLWLAVAGDARREGTGRALLDAAIARLRDRGATLVVAEVAADDRHAAILALLAAAGFDREGVVPDFYRDGVALTLWTRRLA